MRRNVIASFSVWYVALFYISGPGGARLPPLPLLACGACSSRWDGTSRAPSNRWRSGFAHAFAWIITIGNISFPLVVLTGLVR